MQRQILLVEDDPRDLELTLHAFAENGIANAVDVARDGGEGLAYLRRQGSFADRTSGDPVVVLLDLKMPRMDGLEMLREVRADATLATLPIVMLTSSKEERDLVRSYELGVNAFVVKPVGFAELVDAVRAVGRFWTIVNTPPPDHGRRRSAT